MYNLEATRGQGVFKKNFKFKEIQNNCKPSFISSGNLNGHNLVKIVIQMVMKRHPMYYT